MNTYKNIPFECLLNSNRPNLSNELIKSLPDIEIRWINENNFLSYSAMVNKAVKSVQTEYFIMCADKARPKSSRSIYKIINLLRAGYSFVGLYGLGFCGFHKETFRRIGFFDERFIGGCQEDIDFLLRLNEANMAYYYDIEIPYLQISSSWSNYENNLRFLHRKWKIIPIDPTKHHHNLLYTHTHKIDSERNLSEICTYNNEFGPLINTKFLDSSFTIHHN